MRTAASKILQIHEFPFLKVFFHSQNVIIVRATSDFETDDIVNSLCQNVLN